MTVTHNWFVKNLVLPLINNGSKDLEIRLGHPIFKKAEVGDLVTFNDELTRKIADKREYPNLASAIEAEDNQRIYPGVGKTELLSLLRKILKGNDEQLGVIIFELKAP